MSKKAPGEVTPHGKGYTRASREGRRRFDATKVGHLTTEWVPHEHQSHALAVDRGILVLIGALGSGKSEPGALKLIQWALQNPRRADGRPTRWYVIGPGFDLVKTEQFGKLLEHCRRIKVNGGSIVKRVILGIDPKIVLMHDQVILGRSATDPDRLRGHEIDGAWLDEVQKYPEKAFRIAYSRTRSAAATRMVLTGSPEDRPGWVWHLISGRSKGYNKLRQALIDEGNGSGLRVFRWHSSQNKANNAGVLGSIRAVMEASAEGVAAQELEGRFPGTDEAPAIGGAFNFAAAFCGKTVLEPEDLVPAVLGVDVGETRDFTWLTVLSRTGVVLHMDRFNTSTPGVPRKGFYPWLEKRVRDVAIKWGVPCVVVDKAKAGVGVAQHLQQTLPDVVVEAYATDAPGKKAEAIETVGLAMSRGDVRVPTSFCAQIGTYNQGEIVTVEWAAYLRKEFEELVPGDVGDGKNGKRRWDHPTGGHDDGVVSLSLAYYGLGLETGPPVSTMPVWS